MTDWPESIGEPWPTSIWQATPCLTVTALGKPRPKGSLRHVGHGRLVEQVKDGPAWRTTVKDAAVAAHDSHRCPPLEGPLRVEVTVTVAKPQSAPKRRETYPCTRSSGDGDKLLRNIFDALQDAGVVWDDSQFIVAGLSKFYPGQHFHTLTTPGVVIRIWRLATHPVD